jgi:hypothetical protein
MPLTSHNIPSIELVHVRLVLVARIPAVGAVVHIGFVFQGSEVLATLWTARHLLLYQSAFAIRLEDALVFLGPALVISGSEAAHE